MKKTTLVFDFDGTIADSLHMGIELYNTHIAKQMKCKEVDESEVEDLKGRNSFKLLKDHHISLIKLPIILFKLKKLMSQKMDEIAPIEGIKEVLLSKLN